MSLLPANHNSIVHLCGLPRSMQLGQTSGSCNTPPPPNLLLIKVHVGFLLCTIILFTRSPPPPTPDEEIDVVTVVERPKIAPSLRKRPASVSTSAPCSHAPSPTSSPLKSIRKRRYHTKRLQRLSSQAEDYTESDDEQRRASHNVLERKRRNDLKYSFQVLRCQIPDLEENHRAPKVTILRKAAEFIQQMQVRDARLEEEYTRKKLRRAQLLERMAQLRGVPISAV